MEILVTIHDIELELLFLTKRKKSKLLQGDFFA